MSTTWSMRNWSPDIGEVSFQDGKWALIKDCWIGGEDKIELMLKHRCVDSDEHEWWRAPTTTCPECGDTAPDEIVGLCALANWER